MTDSLVLNLVGAALGGAILRTHFQLVASLRRAKRPSPSLDRYPSVTVVRPIRGLDVGARENIRAAFEEDYPGDIELLFVFDDRSEPAIPLVEQAIEEHATDPRISARILFAGAPPEGRTGKLNAMIVAARVAKGELLAACDSDTRPVPSTLRSLVGVLLQTEGAGAAFAPVMVPGPATTAGDVGYALMLNALYGPAAASAFQRDGELPFIMGQYMLFRRDALDAIGGLESADGQLVDDMYIGGRLTSAGYHNVVPACKVPIIQTGMGWSDFLRTYRRWIIFSRSGLPNFSFKWPAWLRGIEFWAAVALSITAIARGTPVGLVLPAAAVLLSAWSLLALNREFGAGTIALKHAWVALALLLLAPFVYFASIVRPRVRWRGRDYKLDGQGRLSHAHAAGR